MIRYDPQYNQEINRVVSNFNRKVRRLEKENRELIPSTVRVRDIKDQFTNKRDLNKYLNDLRRFSKRGAEEIITVGGKDYTRYQIELFRINLRRERAALDRDIRRSEAMKHRYPVQHDINVQNLRSRRARLSTSWVDLIDTKLEEQIGGYFKRLETYDNYFDVLFQDAYLIDYPEDKIEFIKKNLLKLSPGQFMRALQDSPEIQYIFDYYHSLTRQTGRVGGRTTKDAFDTLYDRIEEIVNEYS